MSHQGLIYLHLKHPILLSFLPLWFQKLCQFLKEEFILERASEGCKTGGSLASLISTLSQSDWTLLHPIGQNV